MKKVLIIMGSVRRGRRCPEIANWVAEIGRTQTSLDLELIDLAQWSLPLDDEPAIPATGQYEHAHTRAWAEKVASAQGIVVVTPQYNWGYPAALKNAIDHLYQEWRGKPLLIATYGGHGGNKCAAQLRQVADGLKMQTLSTQPELTLDGAVIRGEAEFEVGRDLADYVEVVTQGLREMEQALQATA